MSHNDGNSSCINNNMKQIKFDLNKSVQVYKILTHLGAHLTKNDVIFIMVDTNGHRQSFLSPASGIISKLYIHELIILSYDSLILEYEECRHTIIFKNLCGDCGMDLKQLKNVLSISNFSKTAISMEPSFPHITIAREEALKYDNEERNQLLRKRKLHLLVDLDQTLVHTTNNENYSPSSPDVIAYRLNTPVESKIFYTKLRPGVKDFLTNLRSLYQFHIFTFGDRPYANTIAKLIDPTGTFFSHRILSRDECHSLTNKTANLSSLFPCGDSLVCMIDDREDVWNYAPNLVHVKPYTWFKCVGDINNTYLPALTQVTEKEHQRGENTNNLNVGEDTDRYLYQLEIILKRIHNVFYDAYDQWTQNKQGIMPDLKQIMPNIRRQVLKSVSLCFSHFMPHNYPLEKHRAAKLAKLMGATVTHDLQFDCNGIIQTTHVIAGKQTLKVYQALQNNIKVVTPEWLIDCYEQWEKKSEENYILTPEYNVYKSRLFIEEIPRVSEQRFCDMQQQPVVYQQPITKRKRSETIIIPLEKEMNEGCIEDDDNFNNICPQSSKRQCTAIRAEIIDESMDDNNLNCNNI